MARKTGILMHRNAVFGSFLRPHGLRRKLRSHGAAFALDPSCWSEPKSFDEVFRKLAQALPLEARRPDCPSNIALPDPIIREEVLDFINFPKDQQEAQALVAWRFARDHQCDAQTQSFCHQVLEQVEDRTRVLTRVGDRELVDGIVNAARHAGFFLARVDGFGGFQSELADGSGRIWANDHWWSLSCRNGTAALFRSGYFQSQETDAQLILRFAQAFALKYEIEELSLKITAPETFSQKFMKLGEKPGITLCIPSQTPAQENGELAALVAAA